MVQAKKPKQTGLDMLIIYGLWLHSKIATSSKITIKIKKFIKYIHEDIIFKKIWIPQANQIASVLVTLRQQQSLITYFQVVQVGIT